MLLKKGDMKIFNILSYSKCDCFYIAPREKGCYLCYLNSVIYIYESCKYEMFLDHYIPCLIFIDVCPVFCKGNGYYYRGQCECFVGWKGVECDIPQNQCLVANCNGHGVCREGECLCYQGFKGISCEEGKLMKNKKRKLTSCS